jgi:hypothetical protein
MTRQVIDAIAAPKEEFHDRIAELPVSIKVSAAGGDAGRGQTRRDYFVSGKLRLSAFVSASAAANVDVDAEPSPEPRQEPGRAGEETEEDLLHPYCEYTHPETNEFFSGECATQQEVDDAYAAIAAMDTEIEAALLEQETVHEEYCETLTEILEEPAADEEGCDPSSAAQPPMTVQQSSPDETPFDAMWGEESLETLRLSSISDDGIPGVPGRCEAVAIFSAITVVGWVGSKWGAIHVLTAMTTVTPPPASAVAWAVFFSLTAGAGAAFAVASYIECMEEEP